MTLDTFVYRDGNWWTFEIPSLTSPSAHADHEPLIAIGQSKTTAGLAKAAADLASLWTGDEYRAEDINITYRHSTSVAAE